MKGLYTRTEKELGTLAKVEKRQRKLRDAEVNAIDMEDSDEDRGTPEDGGDDLETTESHVPSDMSTDPHAIQDAIKMCEMRAERVQRELRAIVLEAFDSTKQGTDGSKEKSDSPFISSAVPDAPTFGATAADGRYRILYAPP